MCKIFVYVIAIYQYFVKAKQVETLLEASSIVAVFYFREIALVGLTP